MSQHRTVWEATVGEHHLRLVAYTTPEQEKYTEIGTLVVPEETRYEVHIGAEPLLDGGSYWVATTNLRHRALAFEGAAIALDRQYAELKAEKLYSPPLPPAKQTNLFQALHDAPVPTFPDDVAEAHIARSKAVERIDSRTGAEVPEDPPESFTDFAEEESDG